MVSYDRYKVAAERTRRRVENVRQFAHGMRFAQGLPFEQLPRSTTASGPGGRLESYFDSHQQGPGIWKWRHYFDIYERHFSKFVGRPVNVVEIGIFSGGSMDMWIDYFGDACHVFGVDIEPACEVYRSSAVSVHIGDQEDRSFWERFRKDVPTVDII